MFLADRNVLVDDPKDKDFAPFGEARLKIQGEAIKSRHMYFATYQSIAKDERRPGLYKEYARDFFDRVFAEIPKHNDLSLGDRLVSRRHAVVACLGYGAHIGDAHTRPSCGRRPRNAAGDQEPSQGSEDAEQDAGEHRPGRVRLRA